MYPMRGRGAENCPPERIAKQPVPLRKGALTTISSKSLANFIIKVAASPRKSSYYFDQVFVDMVDTYL